jgi:hypothetical protein
LLNGHIQPEFFIGAVGHRLIEAAVGGLGLPVGGEDDLFGLAGALGAAGIGMVAFATGNLESSFGFVATSMFMSAAYLAWRGQEPDVGPKQSLHFHGIGVKD